MWLSLDELVESGEEKQEPKGQGSLHVGICRFRQVGEWQVKAGWITSDTTEEGLMGVAPKHESSKWVLKWEWDDSRDLSPLPAILDSLDGF